MAHTALTHNMPRFSATISRGSAEEIQTAVERFLSISRQPILLEPGEDPFPLTKGHYTIEAKHNRLIIQVWDQARVLVRRVLAVAKQGKGRVELVVEKFGKRTGQVILADQSNPAAATILLRGKRVTFREQFRRFLFLHFPNWTISSLSTEQDLENSLSPVYPRALLTRGPAGLAVLASPRTGAEAAGVLTFGLIWLDYLRSSRRDLHVEGLVLFLPSGSEYMTCLRLRFLDKRKAAYFAFVYSSDGYVEPLDLNDYGNLDTKLAPCRSQILLGGWMGKWIERLCLNPDVERVLNSDGSLSLRVRGLPFARTSGNRLQFGLDRFKPASEYHLAEIERLAFELARHRSAECPDRINPLYQRLPEGWLESQVRAHIEVLDASLMPEPIYGQVPEFTAGERSVLDLLAVDRHGRLTVLELKASEDIHLPLQALDYWMRVRWHLDHGDFGRMGYFPTTTLASAAPRLFLVAPSLYFHPTTEVILRYFSPEVPVERIGLGVEWRRKLEVMFRVGGAHKPV